MASPYESDFPRQKWANRVRIAGLVWSAAYLAFVALIGLLILVSDLIGKGAAAILSGLDFYTVLGAVVWASAIAVKYSREGAPPNTRKDWRLFRAGLTVEALSIAAVICFFGVLVAMGASGVMLVFQDLSKGAATPFANHVERAHIVKGILITLPVNLGLFGFYGVRGFL